jgi:hypothetical protein
MGCIQHPPYVLLLMSHFSNDCGIGTVRGAAVDTANMDHMRKAAVRVLGDFDGLLGGAGNPHGPLH